MTNPFLNKIVDPDEILLLKKYDNDYYNGEESITDDVYDDLKELVKKKYPDHPYFDEVGAEISNRKKVKLPFTLGSLSKKKPDGSYDKWNEKYKGTKIISPKLDGVSIMIEFDYNGNIRKAYTRGDGEYGRDITEKAKHFNIEFNVYNLNYLTVRGECILNKDVDYEQFGKNRRSAVSGLINTDDHSNAHLIDCIFYEIVDAEFINEVELESDRLNLLFEIFPNNTVEFNFLDEHSEAEMFNRYAEICSYLPYETDGLVVTLNESERENIKYPEKKVAFKFPNKPVEAKVIDVIYDVGRTGKISARIAIEPVDISGSTISYVTGHNYKYIKQNIIGPGSVIEIVKSGDVIPYVVRSVSTGQFAHIHECMSCGSELVLSSTEIDLYCLNDNCRVKKLQKVAYFVKILGMENITYNTLENLNITNIEDLYTLELDYILNFEGFGIKKAEKILDEIDKSLDNEPYKVLAALGIKGIGKTISKDILSKYSFEELFKLSSDDFIKIDGIGSILADELVKGLKENYNLFQKLSYFGLTFKEQSNTLKNKTYCLTGNGNMPRNNYIEMIENQGGMVKSGMSKKVDILVTKDPDSNSTKMKKARDYGITIISYNDLDKELINE